MSKKVLVLIALYNALSCDAAFSMNQNNETNKVSESSEKHDKESRGFEGFNE